MSIQANTRSKGRSGRGLAQLLLISTALAGVGGVEAAHAQAAATAAAATATAGGATTGLGEVVVTARRQTENLQTTPVSVTAVSGAQVQALNIRNFQDLRGAIPNLEVLPLATGGANLTIRGIGQGSSQVNVDTKVGLYINDFYIARQEGNQLYFYDIDNLQVLKGPQGTLFGKNTTGGAFLLSTAKPAFENGGYLDVRAGSFRRIDAEGAVNMPLSDQLAMRLSFKTDNTDGFIHHILDKGTSDDINDKSLRYQLRWKPTDKFTADFLAEYNQSDTDGSTSIETGCRDNASYVKNYNALHTVTLCTAYPSPNARNLVYGGATLLIPTSAAMTEIATGGDFKSAGKSRENGQGPFNDVKVTTLNVRLNYQLTDDISLKSITGYRRSWSSFYNPTINAPNDIYAEFDDTPTTEWSQEFNLNGRLWGGRLTYVAGLYYESQSTYFLQDTGPDWIDPTGYTYAANTLDKSYAAFVQASLKIIDPLELTVGARYSYDTKDANSLLNFQATYSGALCSTFTASFKSGQACNGFYKGAGSDSWDSFDPMAKLSYQFTPDIFAYLSFTKGYNAGGFNQQLGTNLGGQLVPYNPEKLTAYEGGFKTEWLDKRLRANASVFYQKYEDIQTTLLVTFNGVATRQVQTGATAHEEGIELELEALPTPDLTLRANAAYLRQHYDSIAKGVTSITLNTPVTSSPKFNYSVEASYNFHLPGDKSVVADINWRGVGDKPSCSPIGSCYTPAYGLLGARLDFHPAPDSPWTIGLWGTNLLDTKVEITENVGGGMGIDSYVPGRPREMGVEVRRTF